MNNRTHLNTALSPTNLCLSYIALTPSNNSVNTLMGNGYIHDILLLLVREKLKTAKNLSSEDYENLRYAESIFLESVLPFLVAVPIAQKLFHDTNAGSALEKERREFQILKQ
jgi:hypothetical protein